MQSRVRVLIVGASVTLLVAVASWAYAGAQSPDPESVAATSDDASALCQAAQRGHLSAKDRAWARRCVRVMSEGRKQLAASPTPSASASPSASTPPSSSSPSPKPPASSSPRPSPAPTTSPAGFPDASNTGVPDGTKLSAHSGSCTITTANAKIDAQEFNCDVVIRATGVQITRSRINGFLSVDEETKYSFTLTDSEVHASLKGPRQVTAVGADNFTVLRSEITGGNRGIFCRRACEVRDSWVHGTKITGDWHASAIRASQGSKIIHNRLACDTPNTSPEGGCSANLTMYGDFEVVRDVTVERNLFVANPEAAYCGYGGSSRGKPYSNGVRNVVYRDNVFQRGKTGNCAAYAPIGDFEPSLPGNKFEGNTWDNGQPVKL